MILEFYISNNEIEKCLIWVYKVLKPITSPEEVWKEGVWKEEVREVW